MTQLAIEPEANREITAVPAVPAVRGGIVSRRGLFVRLGQASRVAVVSAPAGSGKTMLLRSWVAQAGLAERVAWAPVQAEGERDPQQFWVAVADALHPQGPGAGDPAGPGNEGNGSPAVSAGSSPSPVTQPLSESEIRVLRYLPSDLTVREIARELCLSVNTIRTHMRRIYEKFQAHCRRDVVKQDRALGLLPGAPASSCPADRRS